MIIPFEIEILKHPAKAGKIAHPHFGPRILRAFQASIRYNTVMAHVPSYKSKEMEAR